jgi:Tfp pilus assembly protein PilN
MRPVNLIPPEERRGERAPSRTGGLAYVVVGVLAAALLAVVGVVLTDNSISENQTKVTELTGQLAQATDEATRLKSYADFATIEQTRTQTVSTLAKSRFDWYRVLHELGLVIPDNVWLLGLQGSVSPEAGQASQASGSSSSSAGSADFSDQITGPSLAIQGCAAGHDAVAGFIGALKDIDGVTRVAVTSSQRLSSSGTSGAGAGAASSTSGCAARDFIAQFQVVVAFDKVPVDPTTGLVPATAPTTTPSPEASDPLAAAGGGAAGAINQEAKVRQSAKQQSAKAHQAVSTLIPGTVSP